MSNLSAAPYSKGYGQRTTTLSRIARTIAGRARKKIEERPGLATADAQLNVIVVQLAAIEETLRELVDVQREIAKKDRTDCRLNDLP